MNIFTFSWEIMTGLVVIINIIYLMAAFQKPKKFYYYFAHALIISALHVTCTCLIIYELMYKWR